MSANRTQHGGTHYRQACQQPWDLAVELHGTAFLECSILKYVSRHRKKNGKEDLLKAAHFLQKLIEVIEERKLSNVNRGILTIIRVRNYCRANSMSRVEAEILQEVFDWRRAADLRVAAADLETMIQREYGEPSAL